MRSFQEGATRWITNSFFIGSSTRICSRSSYVPKTHAVGEVVEEAVGEVVGPAVGEALDEAAEAILTMLHRIFAHRVLYVIVPCSRDLADD